MLLSTFSCACLCADALLTCRIIHVHFQYNFFRELALSNLLCFVDFRLLSRLIFFLFCTFIVAMARFALLLWN